MAVTFGHEDATPGGGNYKFPLDAGNRLKSKISFQAIKVTPPSLSGEFTAAPEYEGSIDAAEQSQFTKAQNDAFGGSITGDIAGLRYDEIPYEKADLYLPLSFQVNDGFNYQQANLGVTGAAVAKGLAAGDDISSSFINSLLEGGNALYDFFTGSAASGEASRLAAARGINSIPLVIPQEVKSAVGITARVTMNPNVRTMFNGVAVREFNFQFKFIPTSAKEATVVKNIIRFFRQHAYPTTIGGGDNFSLAYNYPNMFKIKLMSDTGNGKFSRVGTPIKLCYLKSISSIYNPQTAVLHHDGSPIETDINLTFTEYKALTRQDIINEDDDNAFDHEISQPDPNPAPPPNPTGDPYSGGRFGGR